MQEQEIIQKALGEFRKQTGVPLDEVPFDKLPKDKKNRFDAFVRLKAGKQTAEFKVEAKNELRPIHLPRLLEQVSGKKEEWLIISRYIPKPLKEELRHLGINYLEASGNCFIRHSGLFFYINDQAVTPQRLRQEGKLWKAAGLKFLFAILVHPPLLKQSYRTIASTSGVALGNIGPFIEELVSSGFIKADKKGNYFLDNQEQLEKRWIEFFSSVLKPKMKRGQFRFLNKDMEKNWEKLSDKHLLWGGEPAGALLTNYLTPEKFTIYSKRPKTHLMHELKLIPDERGNVEWVEPFWNYEMVDALTADTAGKYTVPPLLAYAELATSLDSRNRETAERIKQKYLAH